MLTSTLLKNRSRLLALGVVVLALGVAYVAAYESSEPFFNNDETRHVMTGVYFRDVLRDMPLGNLREYTISYYLQYPALGLLVWPPFFYFVEGCVMSVFGTSVVVSKTLVAFFALIACVYLFRLVCLTHADTTRATVATLIFGLSPLVFKLSHYVMLEVPTLALALAAIYHFAAYLERERRRDLALAALFSALAALTRFDAICLLPLFVILLVARGRFFSMVRRREVIVAAALALVLALPFYALSAAGIGWMHFKFVTQTLSPDDPGFFSLRRFLFYPSYLREQLGALALVPAAVGFIAAFRTPMRRGAPLIYLAIVAATYLTFTPMGELESRHAIYWIPAFALFAADGTALITNWLRAPKLYVPVAACVLLAVGWNALAQPLAFVRGYEDAARHVAARSSASPFCLFVGRLNGNFVYHLRRHDDARRLWTLRADKILFSVLIVPGIEARQYAVSDADILDAIYKYDPEYIVVEEPAATNASPPPNDLPPDEQLRNAYEQQARTVIAAHPELFQLEKVVPVENTDPKLPVAQLKVFRNTRRNDNPQRRLEVDLLMLRRSVQTDVP